MKAANLSLYRFKFRRKVTVLKDIILCIGNRNTGDEVIIP